MDALRLTVWRHPQPEQAEGRCIGRTDLRVDARRAKRLAHRIRRLARRGAGPRVVFTSTLQRSFDVGRWLRRWGWSHRVDARLNELDFGDWDGRPWASISASDIDAWCDDFADHAPGGGESVAQLMQRCTAFLQDIGAAPCLVVGHAGWINAARWVIDAKPRPWLAADWPAAVAYGVAVGWPRSNSGGAESQ